LYEPQHDVKYTVLSFSIEFVRDLKSRGWNILVAPPGYVADGDHDDDIWCYVVDDKTAGMIADTQQNPELNIQIISSAANNDDTEGLNSTSNDSSSN
jgi:hypothetical protein